jgi:outer membrane protein assembly factor BamB
MKLGMGYCMPAVSRGRLFMFDRALGQARLRCVASETGKPLWDFTYETDYKDIIGYDNGPRAQPVVDGDRVYLYGPEGMLHCLSVLDGKLLWKLDTAERFHVVQNFFGVGSTPAIEGNLLIVQVGGSPKGAEPGSPDRLDLVKPNGTAIVALDKRIGEVKYQLGDELAGYASPMLATIGGRRWCFMFCRGGLIGFDPATGKQDFHYPWRAKELYSVNASSPVVIGDQVFISECYEIGSSLLKVKPGGFDLLWRDPEGFRAEKALKLHWNTPICVDGFLYGSSGRQNDTAELRCVEWATGKVKWNQGDLGRASLLYVDGHFVCLGEAGRLSLLKVNTEKYEVVAEANLKTKDDTSPPGFEDPEMHLFNYPCWAAPILSHGLLYVRGKSRLACIELIPEQAK